MCSGTQAGTSFENEPKGEDLSLKRKPTQFPGVSASKVPALSSASPPVYHRDTHGILGGSWEDGNCWLCRRGNQGSKVTLPCVQIWGDAGKGCPSRSFPHVPSISRTPERSPAMGSHELKTPEC